MPRFITRRPNNHHHSISKKSDRLETGLAIFPPRVLCGYRRTSKDDRCIGKVQTSFAESSLTFCRIKRDLQLLNVPPFNWETN